jgi:hypothetical protein
MAVTWMRAVGAGAGAAGCATNLRAASPVTASNTRSIGRGKRDSQV